MLDLDALDPLKRHWITKNSNIPVRYRRLDLDYIKKDMGSIPAPLTSWLKDVSAGDVIMKEGEIGKTGVGLLFDGAPGRGKTTHAVAALIEFVKSFPEEDSEAQKLLHMSASSWGPNTRPIYYLTFTDLLYRKKSIFDADSDSKGLLQAQVDGFHGRAKEDHFNVRLLVLDDLGKEYGSKYDDFTFDDILRTRYDKGLPTIITTNVPLEKWAETYSSAMESFAHEAFRRIKLEGEDLRSGK